MSWCSHPEAKALVEHIRATEGLPESVAQDLRRLAWLVSGDTGNSSEAIFQHMSGKASKGSWPWDGADLGRCLRLLEAFPEWRARMPEMAAYGPQWAALVVVWDDLGRLLVGGWDSAVYRWMKVLLDPKRPWDGPEMWNRTCDRCDEVLEHNSYRDLCSSCEEDDDDR